jgi:tRNA modification GTPase
MISSGNPDTIAAIATPPGKGAIAILRISGAASAAVATALLGRLPEPRRATLATFHDADGRALDQGLVVYFPAPASFTGECMVELQGHGGPVVQDALLRRLLQLGCRNARPGEFTERAFHNGKLDIAQAEAVADLIDAGTGAAARAAMRSLRGEFSARVADLQGQLTGLRAWVEASLDFPDEEIDLLRERELAARLAQLFGAFDALGHAARQGALLRDGLTVVIAGPPNAGKSSLMNRLAGVDVAIVTPQAGTTRDVLRERVHLDGIPLHLIDTAGLRAASDPVEAEGIRRARLEIQRADRCLYVVDASAGDAQQQATQLADLPPGVPVTVVYNKIDLHPAPPPAGDSAAPPCVAVSAASGEGLERLRDHLKAIAGCSEGGEGALSARRRHLDALARARTHVQAAADVLAASAAPELFAEDLRLAQQALGEITGEFTSDDLLGTIFASFCIGK